MSRPVELVPLNCIQCSMPIAAAVNEVAWVCPTCGTSMALNEAGELTPCEIRFSRNLPPSGKGKPFWVAEGTVKIFRQSYTLIDGSDREAMQFWGQPRCFFIPAYECGLEEMLAIGTRWLTNPPSLVEGPKTDFIPITHSVADVHAFAEFLILAVEAARKDKVKEIRFELELKPPTLWVLP